MDLSGKLQSSEDQFHQQISRCLPDVHLGSVYEYTEWHLRSFLDERSVQNGRALAKSGLQDAVKKRDQLNVKRKKRHFIIKEACGAQKLATSIVEFLNSFSTVVDIVKGVDQRAGGIAYGTLYILLKTGYNKQRHEDLVTNALDEFSVSLHQLHEYQSAHIKLQRMSSYVREVYNCIIIFAREASIYYTRSGLDRWWTAGVTKIPSVGVEKQIETVRSAIKRVVDEANAVMSKRIETVTKNMTYAHNDSLATLRQTLRVTDVAASSTKIMEACSIIYAKEFFACVSRRGRTILLEDANIALLSTAGFTDLFQSPTQSSVLLLSGTNHSSFTKRTDLCWLSPLALDIGKRATGPLAFYSTQFAGPVESITQRENISNLLGILIYQLLTWEDEFAREWRGTVDQAVSTEAWRIGTLRAQKELLLKLLNAIADRNDSNDLDQKGDTPPTTLIIDRPDAFCIDLMNGGGREWPISDALLELLEILLEVLNEVRGTVKIVVIMHSSFSGENRSDTMFLWEDLEKKNKPPRLVCRRNWEQGRREG